jgi:hypothetical protein
MEPLRPVHRSLHQPILHPHLFRKLPSLLLLHPPPLRPILHQIHLIAKHHQPDLLSTLLPDFLEPHSHGLKALLILNVIHEDNAVGVA